MVGISSFAVACGERRIPTLKKTVERRSSTS